MRLPRPSINTTETRHARGERYVQDEHKREEQDAEQRGCDNSIGRDHHDGLPKGGVVQRVHDAVKEVRKGGTRRVEARCPVPAKKDQGRAKHVPGEFDQYLGHKERRPGEHPRRTLPDFVDSSAFDKLVLQLLC